MEAGEPSERAKLRTYGLERGWAWGNGHCFFYAMGAVLGLLKKLRWDKSSKAEQLSLGKDNEITRQHIYVHSLLRNEVCDILEGEQVAKSLMQMYAEVSAPHCWQLSQPPVA